MIKMSKEVNLGRVLAAIGIASLPIVLPVMAFTAFVMYLTIGELMTTGTID